MDQPAPEILRLEKILDVYALYEKKEAERSRNRNKNRKRHDPTRVSVEE